MSSSETDIRLDRAGYYSPLRFLRRFRGELAQHVVAQIATLENQGALEVVGDAARVRLAYLEWDSAFFHVPVYRLHFPDWEPGLADPVQALATAIEAARARLEARHGRFYLFAEIPSEDLTVLQALGWARSRLIETRLTYCNDDLQNFTYPRRFPVRYATEEDIGNLREVAADPPNRFDRFHADPFFSPEDSARLLSTFVENSVRGFADVVLVPGDGDPQPGAFMTAKLIPAAESGVGLTVARGVLAAWSRKRRGWAVRLGVELNYWLKERGVSALFITTQSANLLFTRGCEGRGLSYGGATHIFSI